MIDRWSLSRSESSVGDGVGDRSSWGEWFGVSGGWMDGWMELEVGVGRWLIGDVEW